MEVVKLLKNLGKVNGISGRSKFQLRMSKMSLPPASIRDMSSSRNTFSFRDISYDNESARYSIYLERYTNCFYNGKYYKSYAEYMPLVFVDRISKWGSVRRISERVNEPDDYWDVDDYYDMI